MAKGCADGFGALERHPVACGQVSVWGGVVVRKESGGARGRHAPWALIEPPVMLYVMSLRPGLRLSILAGVVCPSQRGWKRGSKKDCTDLAVAATFEERSHPNKPNIVIPHDSVDGIVTRNLELVVKSCLHVSKGLPITLTKQNTTHLQTPPDPSWKKSLSFRYYTVSAHRSAGWTQTAGPGTGAPRAAPARPGPRTAGS